MSARKVGLCAVAATGFAGACMVAYDIHNKRCSELHTFSTMVRQYVEYCVLSVAGSKMRKRMEDDTIHFVRVQEETLLQVLKSNSLTEYGMKHTFRDIKDKEQYVVRHPLTRYSDYKEYIDKISRGEKNVLTESEPYQLGVTSGTSGESCLLPTTKAIPRIFFTSGVLVGLNAMFDAFPGSYQLQKSLKFFYSPRWRQTEAGLPVGPNSSSPKSSERFLHLYTTPKDAFNIVTEPEALYVHLLFALKDKNLGIIEGNFAQLVYSGLLSLEANWPLLVTDIEQGKLNSDLEIPDDVRRNLEALLEPDLRRAEELRREFSKGFRGIVRRIWPHINLILACSTGSSELYATRLRERYVGNIPIYSPFYGATEGLIGINLWPEEKRPAYLMVPRAMFFEFIPVEESDKEQPKTLFSERLEAGKLYELVVTNHSGLYRYRIGDVVKVVRFHNNCPVVEFQYRQGQFLNVRGEKTSERVFYDSLVSSLKGKKPRIRVVDYTCAESVMLSSPGIIGWLKNAAPFYAVFLEVSGEQLKKEEQRQLEAELDKCLCELSPVYESFRRKGGIAKVQLFPVKKGAFGELRKYLLSMNPSAANQIKIPRVIKSKEALDVLLHRATVS